MKASRINGKQRNCNKDVLEDAARATGENVKTVKAVFWAMIGFTSQTIEMGGMEAITWPSFGTFSPKMKVYNTHLLRKALPKRVYAKPITDGTIPDQSTGLYGGAKQALDPNDPGI